MCLYFSAGRDSILDWHIVSVDVPGIRTVGIGSVAQHIDSIFCTVVPVISSPYCIQTQHGLSRRGLLLKRKRLPGDRDMVLQPIKLNSKSESRFDFTRNYAIIIVFLAPGYF